MKYIAIHHSAVSRAVNNDQFKATNQYHKEKWNDKSSLGYYGGYNFQMNAAGIIRQYRAIGETTLAQIGFNDNTISICLDGNFEVEEMTPQQKASLLSWLDEVINEYQIPFENVRPHRYFATASASGLAKVKNDTTFETWDGSKPYKLCPGSRYTDKWFRDTVDTLKPKTFTKPISYMESNPDVKMLQEFLEMEGYLEEEKMTPHVYDEELRRAVFAWQKANNVASSSELAFVNGRRFGPKSIKKANSIILLGY